MSTVTIKDILEVAGLTKEEVSIYYLYSKDNVPLWILEHTTKKTKTQLNKIIKKVEKALATE